MLIKKCEYRAALSVFVKVFLVPRDAVTVPTYIKPIFCLANVKTGTQATLYGINTKVGTSKVLFQIKSLPWSAIFKARLLQSICAASLSRQLQL